MIMGITELKGARSMPSNLPRLTVYVDEVTKRKVEALSRLDGRHASNFVVKLIKQAIEEAEADGRLKAEE